MFLRAEMCRTNRKKNYHRDGETVRRKVRIFNTEITEEEREEEKRECAARGKKSL